VGVVAGEKKRKDANGIFHWIGSLRSQVKPKEGRRGGARGNEKSEVRINPVNEIEEATSILMGNKERTGKNSMSEWGRRESSKSTPSIR